MIASDILPMDSLPGVEFLQGDFTENEVFEALLASIGEEGADLVISDMAPNMSGMKEIDQPRAVYLAELALDLARSILKPGAYFLVKVFQGAGFQEFHRDMQTSFKAVKSRKPQASRARSPGNLPVRRRIRGLDRLQGLFYVQLSLQGLELKSLSRIVRSGPGLAFSLI